MTKFNYGLEKRKLMERRKKINKIMRLHGVKEEAIQELNEYDLNSLKKYRCYKRNENVTDSSFFDCQPCYDIIVQDVITKLSAHPDYDLFMEFINKYPQKRTIILMLNDSVSIKKIASFLHISESAVYKQIERMPCQFEKYKRRLKKIKIHINYPINCPLYKKGNFFYKCVQICYILSVDYQINC